MLRVVEKKSYRFIIITLGLFIGLSSFATAGRIKVSDKIANKLFVQGEYGEAIYMYRLLHFDDQEKTFYSYRLGICHFEIGGQNDAAIVHLAESVIGIGTSTSTSPPEALYFYALALHKDRLYRKSIASLLKYKKFVQEDADMVTSQ
ncbi:MAG: hypothetical protein HRT72_03835, partial [Flavobacteriales bacterium]|nr:hypothetical protein [Flavobacteriales bacterium]